MIHSSVLIRVRRVMNKMSVSIAPIKSRVQKRYEGFSDERKITGYCWLSARENSMTHKQRSSRKKGVCSTEIMTWNYLFSLISEKLVRFECNCAQNFRKGIIFHPKSQKHEKHFWIQSWLFKKVWETTFMGNGQIKNEKGRIPFQQAQDDYRTSAATFLKFRFCGFFSRLVSQPKCQRRNGWHFWHLRPEIRRRTFYEKSDLFWSKLLIEFCPDDDEIL